MTRGRDLPHLFDDQADRFGRRDDAGRRRAARRSPIPSRNTSPPSPNVKVGVVKRRQARSCAAQAADHDPGPHAPHIGADLWLHGGRRRSRSSSRRPMSSDPNRTLAENVEAIAALPLMHQPGEVWEYGVSTDVLGRIVEIVEGAPLGEVLQQRLIFGPLGMTDTAFYHPGSEARAARRPVLVRLHDRGGRRRMQCDGAAEIRIRRRWPPVDARRLYALRRDAEPTAARSRACAFSGRERSPSWRATISTPKCDRRPLSAVARPRLRPRLRGAHRPGSAPTAGQRRRVLLGRHDGHGVLGVAARTRCSPSSWFRRRKTASISACCSAIWSMPRSPDRVWRKADRPSRRDASHRSSGRGSGVCGPNRNPHPELISDRVSKRPEFQAFWRFLDIFRAYSVCCW